MARTNPYADFRLRRGRVYVAESGFWGKPDGAIEEFDADSFTSRRIVIEENALGGDVLDFEVLGDHLGVAIVAAPRALLVSFDPATGQRGKVLLEAKEFSLHQLLLDGAGAGLPCGWG